MFKVFLVAAVVIFSIGETRRLGSQVVPEITKALRDDSGGSYHAETVNKDLKTEVARLRQQAVMWWPKEKGILNRLKVQDGAKFVDIGCGPGFISVELLNSYPRSTVTGVELDPKLLSLAERNVGENRGRFQGVHASIDRMRMIPSNSFDVAVIRYVIQHLPDPLAALSEVKRVLKVGGKIIIVDIDEALSGVFAPGPRFKEYFAASGGNELATAMQINKKIGTLFDLNQAQHGGDRFIGRKLYGLLRTAGFDEVVQDTALITSAEYGLAAFKRLMCPDPRAWKFLREGMITMEELQINEHMLEVFFSDPESVVMDLEMIVSATKTTQQ